MRHITAALLIILLASVVTAAPDPANIHIKVSASAEGTTGYSSGSGGFQVADNEYGRVTFSFYGDGQSWRCRAAGSRVGPVWHLGQPDDETVHRSELTMSVDMYLKPRINKYQEIEVTGEMISMVRANDDDPALYTYNEEKLEFILPNGGNAHITRKNVSPWKSVDFEITARTDEPVYQPRTERYLNLTADYLLYNSEADKFEAKDRQCTLGMPVGGPQGAGSCVFHHTFSRDSGDSVMLLTSITVGGTQWRGDSTLSFTFDMIRSYALNPVKGKNLVGHGATINMEEGTLAADKVIYRDFHREITIRAGEKTEIEIPSDSDNMLPFDFTETIVLTNEVETKEY